MSNENAEGGSGRERLVQQRRENRAALEKLGVAPYGARVDGVRPLRELREQYIERAQDDKDHQEPGITLAGRVVLLRDNGSLVWFKLRDFTGDLQLAVSKRDCDKASFDLAKLVDLGDILVAHGRMMRTRTGEVTLWAEKLEFASKCLAPPPEKYAGLVDTNARYKQRYVDLWSNPEVMTAFRLRIEIVRIIRQWLQQREFLEVETPMLQTLAGGAAARPFVTHMNALDTRLFLRIAPELYLKRMLVGGMTRVFELNRNFRNEGLDRSHNPEFTSLEVYQAYGNYQTMLELAESLVRETARHVRDWLAKNAPVDGAPQPADGELKLPFGELVIDYGAPFRRVTFAELFESALGFPMSDEARARKELVTRNLASEKEAQALDAVLVVNELFEEVAEKTLDPAKPTFVLDYPSAISPLTRPKADAPHLAERWDLFIGGMEIGPAYTELNDPDIQEQRFREQLHGLDAEKSLEENTFRSLDQDFLQALEVGMPPAGGLGLGIDRLTMLLGNQRSIRDVILFPMLRPDE